MAINKIWGRGYEPYPLVVQGLRSDWSDGMYSYRDWQRQPQRYYSVWIENWVYPELLLAPQEL